MLQFSARFALRSLTQVSSCAVALAAFGCSTARYEEPHGLSSSHVTLDECSGLDVNDCAANPSCSAFSVECDRVSNDSIGVCPFITQCARADADPSSLPRSPSCSASACAAHVRRRGAGDRPTPEPEEACTRAGCNGEICTEAADAVITACVHAPVDACLAAAICERQPDGRCGFTLTAEQQKCVDESSSSKPK